MINKIYIKDYAIIRELNLSIPNGFTVITGETGAGKSLIVKALSLALGSSLKRQMLEAVKKEPLLRSNTATDQYIVD